MEPPAHQLTQLLQAWSEGDQGALEELMPVVYNDLHRLAQRYMANERPGHTLQPTALVMKLMCGCWSRRTLAGKAGRTFSRFARG